MCCMKLTGRCMRTRLRTINKKGETGEPALCLMRLSQTAKQTNDPDLSPVRSGFLYKKRRQKRSGCGRITEQNRFKQKTILYERRKAERGTYHGKQIRGNTD